MCNLWRHVKDFANGPCRRQRVRHTVGIYWNANAQTKVDDFRHITIDQNIFERHVTMANVPTL
jgi:hypothetical protein